MERLPDLLIQEAPWAGLVMGNHALVRAMIEAGTMVVSTYPGSPTPEIAEAITSIAPEKRPMYFEYSVNEKVASEVAFGAAINGHPSAVFFKSVGLNVASDSVVQFGLMHIEGGLVVILGDDPGVNSSQNEQDNRHFCRMSYIPMFEPATPNEVYLMYLEAARLAQRRHMAVFLRLTTHVCHAREKVSFGQYIPQEFDWSPHFDSSKEGPYIAITKTVFPMKARALDRLGLVEAEGDESPVNAVLEPNGVSASLGLLRGVISASLPAMSLMENLKDSGAQLRLLKLGLSYPLPRKKILDFLRRHDEVLIVEELDRVMEAEIKMLAYDNEIHCAIFSRSDEFLSGELTSSRTMQILRQTWPEIFTPKLGRRTVEASVVPRTPLMCPGCGHRAAFYAIKKALPEGAITVADIGCHTMGSFEPYKMGEVMLCMGASSGIGSGLALGNRERRVLSFIGDSTLFHAGLPGIVNAVQYDHDFLLVVMDNGITAMTGHQLNAGSPEGGNISIEDTLKALGVKHIRSIDCYKKDELGTAVREALEIKGFKVIIAQHPCMLQFSRKTIRKLGEMPGLMSIDAEKCEKAYECSSVFDCPSFVRGEDGSISVHRELCIGDGSCRPSCPHTALELKKRKESAR